MRALRHACERAVILAQADLYAIGDFGLHESVPAAAASAVATDALTLDVLERDAVAAALAQVQGNISRAARLLGISRAALYRKLEKHAL